MKYLAMIPIIGVACSVLFGCSPLSTQNQAYVKIGLKKQKGLGLLSGNSAPEITIAEADGNMSPERYILFKNEEGRLNNIATAQQQLDSAIIIGDSLRIAQLTFVIERLQYMGGGGYGGRGGYLRPVVSNKPLRPIIIENNSSRSIRMTKPIQLAGVELGPHEATPIGIMMPIGTNQVSYTEYELGKSRVRNQNNINVHITDVDNKLVITDNR